MTVRGPNICSGWKATGKTRHRQSFFGKVILQIEIEQMYGVAIGPPKGVLWESSEKRWRDASFFRDFELIPGEVADLIEYRQ